MRVCVYGAGAIGCYLTHELCSLGHEVTLVARGDWGDYLAKNGLTIYHSRQNQRTVDHPIVVKEFDPDEMIDMLFVCMQYQQLAGVLDEIARCRCPHVICIGNNIFVKGMEEYILSKSRYPKEVVFALQSTGGYRTDKEVVCTRLNEGGLCIGGASRSASMLVKQRMGEMFKNSRFMLDWYMDMDSWCKSHLAFYLPLSYLCYALGTHLQDSTPEQQELLLDAANEAFYLLEALDVWVLPEKEHEYYKPGRKRRMTARAIRHMMADGQGDPLVADHNRHAVTEMEYLDRAFMEMREEVPGFQMPNFDKLRAMMPSWESLHEKYDGRCGRDAQ